MDAETKQEIEEILEVTDKLFYRIRDLRNMKFHSGVTSDEIESETRNAQDCTETITDCLQALLPEENDD